MTKIEKIAYSACAMAFAALLVATDFNPMLPLVKGMIALHGAT